jgi:hypothetical protein
MRETECVYCAVRAESLDEVKFISCFKYLVSLELCLR